MIRGTFTKRDLVSLHTVFFKLGIVTPGEVPVSNELIVDVDRGGELFPLLPRPHVQCFLCLALHVWAYGFLCRLVQGKHPTAVQITGQHVLLELSSPHSSDPRAH